MNYTELMNKCRTCRFMRTSDDPRRKEKGTVMWCNHPQSNLGWHTSLCFHARCAGIGPAICGLEATLWEPIE